MAIKIDWKYSLYFIFKYFSFLSKRTFNMDIVDQILSNLKNSTDVPFTYEATNITGIVDFLKTVNTLFFLKTNIV